MNQIKNIKALPVCGFIEYYNVYDKHQNIEYSSIIKNNKRIDLGICDIGRKCKCLEILGLEWLILYEDLYKIVLIQEKFSYYYNLCFYLESDEYLECVYTILNDLYNFVDSKGDIIIKENKEDNIVSVYFMKDERIDFLEKLKEGSLLKLI